MKGATKMNRSDEPRKQVPLQELKQTIALGNYRPDPGAVADAILWKIGVMKRLRQDLTLEQVVGGDSAADRTPQPRAPSRSRDAAPSQRHAVRDRFC